MNIANNQDQEAVDGILVQFRKADYSIFSERSSQVQKHPGYEVRIVIPEWDRNSKLLGKVKKAHRAQENMLSRLKGKGVSRKWRIERFNEHDKALVAILTTLTETIRTRRWREKESSKALDQLQSAFTKIQHWSAKSAHYCHLAEQCTDPIEKETVLDAACLCILKIGELINKVEKMQHGFWRDFSAVHFINIRHMRNLIGHTEKIEGEDVIPIGTGIIQELQTALGKTFFSKEAGPGQPQFLMPPKVFLDLEPIRPNDVPSPDNSVALVRLNENNRFVIVRLGRSEENKLLVSSSVTGPLNLSLFRVSREEIGDESDPYPSFRNNGKLW
ncbi:MAG: hypothetical protein OXH90_03620 [Paracoccaceae bacterium]|nr:hypothetical protein [Paracoccaceae bacterium]MDE2916919.1 hypothetical protein [Paracoccaceae bacterium]